MDPDTKRALGEVLRIAQSHSGRLASLECKLQALTMFVGCVMAEIALATPDARDKLDNITVGLHGMIDGLVKVAPQDAEVWRQMTHTVEVAVRAAEGLVRPCTLLPTTPSR